MEAAALRRDNPDDNRLAILDGKTGNYYMWVLKGDREQRIMIEKRE